MNHHTKIAVIGLGYVGLPLAVHFGAKFHTTGFDLKEHIIENCKKMKDPTGEVSKQEFEKATYFYPTLDSEKISDADYIIIAVPTPIDRARRPDLTYLENSCDIVGKQMKKGVVVIFESTVYPGVTEDICVPVLEKVSGYKWKKDFHVGYSPERINPGDREHTLPKIVKVVATDDKKTCDKVADLYAAIITAGVHQTETIKEAEAAKVIENTQRDLNIALMNELALIFNKLNIDTKNVLDAACSKWNFLPFKPGLVGGHCIGVDPYYLTFKAESEGYHPQIILSGRRINDNMGRFVVEQTVKMMIQQGMTVKNATVGVLGLAFKENCPDLRNTRVIDIVEELASYGINVLVHDAICDPTEAFLHYSIDLCRWEELTELSALIFAVPHKTYTKKNLSEFQDMLCEDGCLVDVKSVLDPEQVKDSGINYWRL